MTFSNGNLPQDLNKLLLIFLQWDTLQVNLQKIIQFFDHVFICCYAVQQVWSLTEGSCLMTLTGHHDAVTCLNLTFDSRKVISGSLDHNLKFWDLLNGKVSTDQHAADFCLNKLSAYCFSFFQSSELFHRRHHCGVWSVWDLQSGGPGFQSHSPSHIMVTFLTCHFNSFL